jgi:hypothetical protein
MATCNDTTTGSYLTCPATSNTVMSLTNLTTISSRVTLLQLCWTLRPLNHESLFLP